MPSSRFGIATFVSGALAGTGAGLSLASGSDPLRQVPLAVTAAALGLALAALAMVWGTRARAGLAGARESTLHAQVAALQERLRQQTALIDQLARTDAATGVLNAAAFKDKVEDLILHSARYDRPYSMVLIQIQRPRGFAGEGSRNTADSILQTVARSLASATRGTDIVARWDDGVFVVCLDGCRDPQPAISRFLVGLNEENGAGAEQAVQVTVGAAVVERWSPEITLDALLQLAGEALASVAEGTGSRSCRRVFPDALKSVPAAS